MFIKNKYIIILTLSLLPILYFLITYSNVSNANINLNTIDNTILKMVKKFMLITVRHAWN